MAEAKLDVEELVRETFGKHFGVTFDRLRELAEADKDGRFIKPENMTKEQIADSIGYLVGLLCGKLSAAEAALEEKNV